MTTEFSETQIATGLLTEFRLAMISSMEAMELTQFMADLETTRFTEMQMVTLSSVVLERTLFTVETALI